MLGEYCRPPNSPQETEEQLCSQILEQCEKSRVVVVGNFNFPHIDWDSLTARGWMESNLLDVSRRAF